MDVLGLERLDEVAIELKIEYSSALDNTAPSTSVTGMKPKAKQLVVDIL